MTVADLLGWIAGNREALIARLQDGSYQPQPVRGVSIFKPSARTARNIANSAVSSEAGAKAAVLILASNGALPPPSWRAKARHPRRVPGMALIQEVQVLYGP